LAETTKYRPMDTILSDLQETEISMGPAGRSSG